MFTISYWFKCSFIADASIKVIVLMWLHFTLKNLFFKWCVIFAGVQCINSAFGIDLMEEFRFTDVSTNTAVVIFTVNVIGDYRDVVL